MAPAKVLCPICNQENTTSLAQDTYSSCSHYVWDPIDFPEGPASLCLDGAFVSTIRPTPEQWRPYKASLEAVIKGFCIDQAGWLFIESDNKRYDMYAEIRQFMRTKGAHVHGSG